MFKLERITFICAVDQMYNKNNFRQRKLENFDRDIAKMHEMMDAEAAASGGFEIETHEREGEDEREERRNKKKKKRGC